MVLILPIEPPEEGLVYRMNNTKFKIGNVLVGNGTIYITQNSLSWQPDNRAEGIAMYWKQISVHGISSEPVKCIYLMVDHKIVWRGVYAGISHPTASGNVNGNGANDGEPMEGIELPDADSDDNDNGSNGNNQEIPEEEEITECWFIPEDANTVDTIFQAMTECQALHPDSADSLSDDSDGADNGIGDEDEDDDGSALGPMSADNATGYQNGNRNRPSNDGSDNENRFADADE